MIDASLLLPLEARLWLRREVISSAPLALHRGKSNAKARVALDGRFKCGTDLLAHLKDHNKTR